MRRNAGACLQTDTGVGRDVSGSGAQKPRAQVKRAGIAKVSAEPAIGGNPAPVDPSGKTATFQAGRTRAEELQRWLMRNYLRRTDVASALGVTRAAITLFIVGKLKSARIRDWFVAKGCPGEFLP